MNRLRVIAACVLFPLSVAQGGNISSSAPPEFVFVPWQSVSTLLKHPSRPLLYLTGSFGTSGQRLATCEVAADGAIRSNTLRVCDNYFTAEETNTLYAVTVRRPTVLNNDILYVGITPSHQAGYYAHSNNQEIAVLRLDDAGQPRQLLRAFRSNLATQQPLINLDCDPVGRRLFLAYYAHFGWYPLDDQGLPVTDELRLLPSPFVNLWYGQYVPEWRRFFLMPPGAQFAVLKVGTDGMALDFCQLFSTPPGSPVGGNFVVSIRYRALYVLATDPGAELTVWRLTREGTPTSLPRSVPMAGTVALRFDFRAGRLYAFRADGVRVHPLNADGLPEGDPRVHLFSYGTFHDAVVDEDSGKVYVACSQPPAASP